VSVLGGGSTTAGIASNILGGTPAQPGLSLGGKSSEH